MTASHDMIDDLREEQLVRIFELDALYDGLTSGRLCGETIAPRMADTILVLLERLDWKPDFHALAAAMPHFPERFGLAQLRSALVNLGFGSSATKIVGRRLRFCQPGTLVCDDRGELWLIRAAPKHIELFQPGEAEKVARVRPSFVYRTLQFQKQDDLATRQAAATRESWSRNLIFRFTPELRLMLFLTLCSGLSAILVAFGITKVFDTIIPTRSHATLVGLLIGLGMVAVAELVLRHIRAKLAARVTGRVEYILGTALFGKLLRLPAHMLTSVSESEQFARLKQFEGVRDLVGGSIVLLALELCMALLLVMAVAFIAWQLALLLVGLAMVFTFAAWSLGPAIYRANQTLGTKQSRFNEVTFDLLSNAQQIRRNSHFNVVADQMNTRLRDLIRARRKAAAHLRFLDGISFVSLPIAASSVIGTGALLVMQNTISSGQLIAATILTWRLFAPVQQSLQVFPKLPEIKRLLSQLDTLFKLPEEDGRERGEVTSPCYGNIALEDVIVRFPGALTPSLAATKLSIPRGKLVTITGPTGSGKSTLLRVLAGSLKPQSGVVSIDGLNVSQLSRAYRARHIAYVSQDPLFFYGTVAQNLRLNAPDAYDARILRQLKQLGLAKWIDSLPEGIDTRIDPTASDILSPGVRTMLGIAQALLVEPAILLLDEPTGGLDAGLEAGLMRALDARRGAMTTLMVTHRPSLIQSSDGVIVLNGGRTAMRVNADRQEVAS